MKSLIVLLIIIAVGFFGYPLLSEDSSSECDAAERAFVRLAQRTDHPKEPGFGLLLGELAQGLCNGKCAYVLAQKQYEHLPASAGCAMLFWRARTDPDGFLQSLNDTH